jgi:DNA-binding FrmR family transcriptional regulator
MKSEELEQSDSSYSDRINRIRGQVNGIAKMIEDDRACMDIVQQVVAARSALTRLGTEILKEEAIGCTKRDDKESLNLIIEKLFKLT